MAEGFEDKLLTLSETRGYQRGYKDAKDAPPSHTERYGVWLLIGTAFFIGILVGSWLS